MDEDQDALSDEAQIEPSNSGPPTAVRYHLVEPTLFVTDAEIIRRLGVSEKVGYAAIHRLEKTGMGFPEKQRVWGKKRYWPAVKQWFDRRYGVERTGG